MREGGNIQRHRKIEVLEVFHKVLIPVYIPELKGYYQDALEILKLSLDSLIKTKHQNTAISVISNGSCTKVNQYLMQRYLKKDIHELIIVKDGIGKINSLLKCLRTVESPFVTVADADVLYDNHWEQEVFKTFKAFPKAGVVSPVPVFRKHFDLTANIWWRFMFSNRLQFRPVKNPEAMTKFANSIGWPWLDDKWKDVYAVLKNKDGIEAMVGATHFVATYKSSVFSKMPKENSRYYLGGKSVLNYLDEPVIKSGGWRLTTMGNYAYHMGNSLEDWMIQVEDGLFENSISYDDYPNDRLYRGLGEWWLQKAFDFLLSIPIIKRRLLRKKGLNSQQVSDFTS